MDYYLIGQRIRQYRKAKGLSQEELAEKINISTTHMSHIETANTKLSLPVFVDIVEALGIKADDLLSLPIEEAHERDLPREISAIFEQCSKQEAEVITDIVKATMISLKKHF